MPLKIAVYCCSSLIGEGLKQLMDGNTLGISIHAVNCRSHTEVSKSKPDLLVTDYYSLSSMPLDEKIDFFLLKTACQPDNEDEIILNHLPKGLVGILPINADLLGLEKAIKSYLSEELWFDRKKQKNIIDRISNDKIDMTSLLTGREQDIIKLICKGCRNKEIMKALEISEQSVKSHLGRINKKLGVSDRLQVALYAIKHWPSHFNAT